MLNFSYLTPPAIVQPAEVQPVEVETPAEPPKLTRREIRQQTPMEERSARARSFAKSRLKDQLRPVLMAIDPRCHKCGLRLQDEDSSNAATFARVMLREQKLACEACVNEISRGKNATGKQERLQERIDEFLRTHPK
jgi:hypothetical protein